MSNKLNYIFDIVGEKGRPMRGFLDMETQEVVIYDDSRGKELFRIGGQGQNNQLVKRATKKKLSTLTFIISNGSAKKETATLFASNLEPLIQPLGVSVIIKEIENQVFNSHNYLRRDILSNKLKIVGFSYFVQNSKQFDNDLQFGTIKPYGVVEAKPFSPLNFLSGNQYQSNMMDMSKKFNWSVDSRSVLYVPIEPKSKVTLLFNVLEDVDMPLISEYKDERIKKIPVAYDAEESNTIFKNANSGGLGAVNFDGSTNIDNDKKMLPVGLGYVNFDGGNDSKVQNVNNDKKHDAIIGVIKLGIVVTGVVLIVHAISKFKK